MSGAYIEADPGEPGGKKQTEFKALSSAARAPNRTSQVKVFVIEAKRLGALSTGSPVYYRDVEVGEVLSYDLGSGLGPVTLRVFVRAPFDKFVHEQTPVLERLRVVGQHGAGGHARRGGVAATLLSGGIAFETSPRARREDAPATESSTIRALRGQGKRRQRVLPREHPVS